MGNETLLTERGKFLEAAVMTLLHQVDKPMLLSIIAGGESQFIAHARSYWTGHGFTSEDYRKAFAMLKKRAIEVVPYIADAG
jgi:hypothetical protein